MTETLHTVQESLESLECDVQQLAHTFNTQQQEHHMKNKEQTALTAMDMSTSRPEMERAQITGALSAFSTYLRYGDQGFGIKALSAGEGPGSYLVPAPVQERVTPVSWAYPSLRATQKFLDDSSINVEEWLVSRISDKMLRIENQAFIHGNGQAQPKGFLSYELVATAD